MKTSSAERQLIAQNRKAFHEYEILDRFEAGVVLRGTEVKAIRQHGMNLKESYARILNGQVWLENCHIAPYSHGNIENHDPRRARKLLLNRREINKLLGETTRSGLTIVPLQAYFKRGKAKIEIALARGKKVHDKRETARRRIVQRELEKELKKR